VALLELEFLSEIGRLRGPVSEVWKILHEDYGVTVADSDLQEVCRQARQLSWTRDPFDRLIAAQAMLADALLLTADEAILARCPVARWD
jgi:PIN domain nuclease of toxin-antitoxin system